MQANEAVEKKILIVDDNVDHQELMKEALISHHPSWEVHVVGTGEEALAQLRLDDQTTAQFSLILLDYSLPEEDGLAVVQ